MPPRAGVGSAYQNACLAHPIEVMAKCLSNSIYSFFLCVSKNLVILGKLFAFFPHTSQINYAGWTTTNVKIPEKNAAFFVQCCKSKLIGTRLHHGHFC